MSSANTPEEKTKIKNSMDKWKRITKINSNWKGNKDIDISIKIKENKYLLR